MLFGLTEGGGWYAVTPPPGLLVVAFVGEPLAGYWPGYAPGTVDPGAPYCPIKTKSGQLSRLVIGTEPERKRRTLATSMTTLLRLVELCHGPIPRSPFGLPDKIHDHDRYCRQRP